MILRNLDLRDKRQSKEFEAKLNKMIDACELTEKHLASLSEVFEGDEVLENIYGLHEALSDFWIAKSALVGFLLQQKHRLIGNPKALTKDIIEYAELGA